ncbi:unnamed protein product [Zymoseptoria tritici ST99CH_1A5]|uniref:SAM-dependent MTase RsmB/NOP-type domain-containing protein n=3 Tax=Zymoseptoria tritici TaxID=1047171 RepID=F9X271_ZYMTI|nr:uncharacterized protein MYCGRDRAFT_107930 [Zymoseptoria tritici IPO323]EGP90667.1 hypothetical protein MYCGRDRAFT_107930 [Zymoseptoria tritici IPO323]SMQ47351.1 unnamed protein product [Zymoseptoria tritici ST99CH_3D7]SMY21034.1 unnamed protein product [Zymoseptoria tritici ST99CH_1A5]
MSLYHEAAECLTVAQKNGGSLKSVVFGKKTWKTDARTLFAVCAEAAKWSTILSEVVEKSGILKLEKNLTPTLALLLTHDLLLAKKGVALPATHGLNAAVSRHKARLSAELTKVRIRRRCATLDDLRALVNADSVDEPQAGADGSQPLRHPRWIRINTFKANLEEELKTTFSNYTKVEKLNEITHAAPGKRLLYVDDHVPDLIATAGPDDTSSLQSYKNGKFIYQEKASCFPAYLLNPTSDDGDIIDTCAAPGNKTTHVAAILSNTLDAVSDGKKRRVTACEKDPERSKTLEKMVKLAGANNVVTIKAKQDFLRIDPTRKDVSNVTALLLDPSCSGSGIVGRDEATLKVHLPSATAEDSTAKGRKRKRSSKPEPPKLQPEAPIEIEEEVADDETDDKAKLEARLEKLSTFQLRLLQHAMAFPAARKISYSTCSIHSEENENVVVKALLSDIAQRKGWRIMKRADQVDGMRRWHQRGLPDAVRSAIPGKTKAKFDVDDVAEGCIRCEKGGEDGTMGFFVAGFVRDGGEDIVIETKARNGDDEQDKEDEDEDEEFNGFSEDET